MLEKLQYIVNSSTLFDEYVRVPKWKERLLSTKLRIKSEHFSGYYNIYELSSDYAGGNSIKLIFYESPTISYLFPLTDDFYFERISVYHQSFEFDSAKHNNVDLRWEFNSLAHEQLSMEKHLNFLFSNLVNALAVSDSGVTVVLKELLEVIFVRALKCSVIGLNSLEAEYELLSLHQKSLSDEDYQYYSEILNDLSAQAGNGKKKVFVFKRDFFAYYVVEYDVNSDALKIDLIGKEKFSLKN